MLDIRLELYVTSKLNIYNKIAIWLIQNIDILKSGFQLQGYIGGSIVKGKPWAYA